VGLQRHQRAEVPHFPTSDGYWKIIKVNSGKGLDIKDVSTAQNALVHQWSYVGGNNQQFKFVGRGNNQFSIHARHTGMALDLYWGSADNGTTIVQYPYTGGGNQLSASPDPLTSPASPASPTSGRAPSAAGVARRPATG